MSCVLSPRPWRPNPTPTLTLTLTPLTLSLTPNTYPNPKVGQACEGGFDNSASKICVFLQNELYGTEQTRRTQDRQKG